MDKFYSSARTAWSNYFWRTGHFTKPWLLGSQF